MKREVSLDEISDGKLYSSNDLAKADCQGCVGCSSCCSGMGTSIVLDPLDVYRLSANLNYTFEGMLNEKLELNIVDGMILPNLRMAGEKESCAFLNGEGRCSIHSFRPGICRLFPLGRFYENGGFKYFLQVHECPKANKTKVKIKKWLDMPELKKYEEFTVNWHYFLLDAQEKIADEPESMKEISMYVLNQFYVKAFQSAEDFYTEFTKRLEEAKQILGI